MPGPPGLGIAGRLLKPLIKHLARKAAATAPRAGKQQSPYEIVRDLGRSVIDSTFGHPGGKGRALPIYERIPAAGSYGGKFGQRITQLRNGAAREYSTGSTRFSSSQTTTFVASRLRPNFHSHYLRGPAQVSHVGLRPSPSRTFATYGTTKIGHELQRNVPIGLRALADRLKHADERAMKRKVNLQMRRKGEETKVVVRSLRKWEKEHGGNKFVLVADAEVEQQTRQTRRAKQFTKYFPLAANEVVRAAVAVPAGVEDAEAGPSCPVHTAMTRAVETPLFDPDTTTYLLLPLSPSLSHLLTLPSSPSASIDQSYVPRDELPDVINTVLPIHLAYDAHTRLRLIPLLVRLNGKGCFDTEHLGGSHVEPWLRGVFGGRQRGVNVEVVYGPVVLPDGSVEPNAQEPEALRLTFSGYTEHGVKALIGGDAELGRNWWYIYSVKHAARSTSSTYGLDSPISSSSSAIGSFSVSDTDSLFDSSLMAMTSGTVTPGASEIDLASSWATVSPRDTALSEAVPVDNWEVSAWRMPTVDVLAGSISAVPLPEVEEMERVEEQIWGRG